MGLTWGQAILHSNPHQRNVFLRKTFEFYSRFRTEETETERLSTLLKVAQLLNGKAGI